MIQKSAYCRLIFFVACVVSLSGCLGPEHVASIDAHPARGEAPLTVAFTYAGRDSYGTIVSYDWTFGDGNTSKDQNPIHTYHNPGSYIATLVVTYKGGNAVSGNILITVTPKES